MGIGPDCRGFAFLGRKPVTGGRSGNEHPPPAPEPKVNAEAPAPAITNKAAAMVEQTDEAELAEAATKPISTEKPLPASLKLMGPLSELIKLANSGVDESVLMAYVANSARPFNLDVEEIIYLNDIGVSGSVVTAMLQRDEALKGLIGSAVPAQAVPAPSAPATEPALAPGSPALYAPQPAPTPAPTEWQRRGRRQETLRLWIIRRPQWQILGIHLLRLAGTLWDVG